MSSFVSYGFLTPPVIFVLLCLLGAWLALSHAPLGLVIALVSSLCLYATSMPLVGSFLLERIEAKIPINVDLSAAQAIVVLGGDIHQGHGEEKDTLGPYTLERLALAAQAYRKFQLPVAVTGGAVHGAREPEAWLMKSALDSDFSVPVKWVEDAAGTTYENAVNTQRLMHAANVDTVIVVTQAWHMPRALWAFEQVGLHALPWPAPRDVMRLDGVDDVLPSMIGLQDSFLAFHEMLGSAYYRLRF